ncbi:phosphatase PAP2 family protein [Sphingomonas sp. IW22]|uniref:phosphatase PAP2 family protein n=1 Tax=Sphingomonas sp. IW22 TaxID=3242489 RepID=UPI0035218CDC
MAIAATAAALIAMLVLPYLVGFSVDIASFKPIFLFSAALMLFVPYAAWRNLQRLRFGMEASALGLMMTLPVLVFSYSAMRVAMPLADQTLIAIDRSLGFNWLWYVSVIDASPLLAKTLAYAYSSFALQLLLMPIALSLLSFEKRAFQMVLAYLVLCTLSIAISTFFPAVGAYKAFGVAATDLENINAHFGYFFLKSFYAVRGSEVFILDIKNASGIVTFPSIHVGVSVLCGWASWQSVWLRIPMLILNILMAISAVTHGSHYLFDVLGGVMVAIFTIRLVLQLSDFSRLPSSSTHDRPVIAASIANKI